jgi:hypothetical protein
MRSGAVRSGVTHRLRRARGETARLACAGGALGCANSGALAQAEKRGIGKTAAKRNLIWRKISIGMAWRQHGENEENIAAIERGGSSGGARHRLSKQ